MHLERKLLIGGSKLERQSFFEVFPAVKLTKDIESFFKDVMIEKVTMYKGKKLLEIRTFSTHIIPKYAVIKAEEILALALFTTKGQAVVKIAERFELSKQYNLQAIVENYKMSFNLEMSTISKICYRIMSRASWEVNDDLLILRIEETHIARVNTPKIREYLMDTILERFGLRVRVDLYYDVSLNTNLMAESLHTLGQEIKQIVDNVEALEGKNDSDNDSENVKNAENNETKKGAKVSATKGQKAGGGAAKPQFGSKKSEDKSGDKKGYERGFRKRPTDDPDCFYGRNVDGDCIEICEVSEEIGEFCIRGEVISIEERETKAGKFLIIANITDYTDTIAFKLFVSPDDIEAIREELKKGKFYKLKGTAAYDMYSKEVSVASLNGIKQIPDFREKKMDNSLEKRVELHLHTVMSENDSVVDIKKVIKRAKDWGHKALAITDHGVVQAFTVANHEVKPSEDFKLIYGVEGYFVEDTKSFVRNSVDKRLDEVTYVVFDIETTGFSAKHDKIIEIGAVKLNKDGEVAEVFSQFINPEVPIPYEIEQLTSINDHMVMNAPTIEVVLPMFLEFCKDSVLVAHNASFDTGFIREKCRNLGYEYNFTSLDTMTIAQVLIPELGRFNLDRMCNYFNLKNNHHHRACDDADVTAKIFLELMKLIRDKKIDTIDELNEYGNTSVDFVRKSKYYHGIILVKNEIGRVNLYRLISDSHLTYYNQRPRIPKSLINKYREGLIIGSACEAGELYRALVNDDTDEEIARIVRFYDYLEIQPTGNNMFLIDKKDNNINSVEDIQNLNKRVIELGRVFNKPVVATGDVHFLDPEDSLYRAIVMAGKGFPDADRQPPLYYRTTEEMLEEFSYLGSDLAREVVITNTNKIADMIDKISPVRPDKQPPIIPNSDETLTRICYNKAHEIYGPDLPGIVVERLERELNSIIKNGFAVMYIIAQMLVWKSNEDGYLVGSRGSVGSSFVATMSGITEVNPLSAHYICPKCYYVDFDSPEVKAFSGMSGCDMPDKICPKCGGKLNKEGHDIPFETFLGFKGDKEPDIDLNFSGEYQPNAHAYTEKIFGEGKAFRAGTIGTLAEKTAFGYVYNYYNERGIIKRRAEMERISIGCTGVKRTTGQHPGGMIVLPTHEEIYSFSPIQHPANDMTTPTITTHFEYHSIDHNLLKLDILGHDDPTMIRRLEDITGIDAKTVPLDDKDVMSLFHSPKALGIEPEDIGGTRLGSLGIPEFGTDFAMQMVIDANPQSFSDLVRISGLSHGTDVWVGNAKTLIEEGKCVLSSAICCRDDIMIYLINMGLEKGLSFKIMESVRKGKGLSQEMEDEMLSHGVPDWYIWSCKKIKYMFPKAHAAAYVMMAWRIAYYKVNYPLAYYCAFFAIRASAFDYEMMCQGREHLDKELDALRKMDKSKQTAKDQDKIKDLRMVQEMYARGFEFEPIDIYKADAVKFQIINGKIMPSLASIGGMGEKAAQQLYEAAKDGVFMSKEELYNRSKVSKTVIEKMSELGILGDMPDTSQLTFIFD